MKKTLFEKINFRHFVEWIVFQPFAQKLDDQQYIRLFYYAFMGKKLNMNPPKTFNEKLQWLKLHDRKPIYSKMADKYEMKQFVSEIVGKGYVIPTLGVWDTLDEIDFEKLPQQFVLKTTHDSGGIVICKDKSKLNYEAAKEKINKSLKKDYYLHSREWPYRDIPHRIIAEEYMDNHGKDLVDYKIHCFNGEPKVILVCKDRFTKQGLTEDFFDTEWNHLEVRRPNHPLAKEAIAQPSQLEKMLELSRKLSENIPFLRVDFYEIDGRVYIGELTFFPASGVAPFIPERFDYELGKMLRLPKEEC